MTTEDPTCEYNSSHVMCHAGILKQIIDDDDDDDAII